MQFCMGSGGVRVAGSDNGLGISWSLMSSLVTTPSGSLKVSFKPSSGLTGSIEVICEFEEAIRQLRLAGYRVEQTKVNGDQVMITIMGEEHLP